MLGLLTKDSRSRGQGFAVSKAVRDAVEQHAMRVAQKFYESAGWSVDASVAATHPYDLRCTQPSRPELRVEVKGTTSNGEKIFLTKNEVAHTDEKHPNVELFIVARVGLTKAADGAVTASGGEWRVIKTWSIGRSAL